VADDDDNTPPTRDELLAAREDLKRELELVRNPPFGRRPNPYLVQKLKAMLAAIEECLVQMDGGDGQRT
jgi:hypothetical protein